jgi:hypothetical protein
MVRKGFQVIRVKASKEKVSSRKTGKDAVGFFETPVIYAYQTTVSHIAEIAGLHAICLNSVACPNGLFSCHTAVLPPLAFAAIHI